MTTHRSLLDQRVTVLVAAWSVLATALGMWWLAEPERYPFGPGDEQRILSLLSGLTPGQGSSILVGAGVVGTAAATAHALRRRPAPAGLVGLAAVYAAVFVLVVPDVQLLIVLGYCTALLLPLGVLAVPASTLRAPRPALVAAGALTFFVVMLAVSGTLDAGALSRFAQSVGSGFLDLGTRPLKVLFLAAGGTLWGVLAVLMQRERTGRCARCGRPGAAWTTPAAVLPGVVVSLSLAVGGLSIAQMMIAKHEYAYLLVFPFVIWSPLLAAATYAYYLRRRGACRLEQAATPAQVGTLLSRSGPTARS